MKIGGCNLLFVMLLSLLFTISCSSSEKDINYDHEAAFKYLVMQCDLGARVPNTKAHQQAKDLFISFFDSLNFEVVTQPLSIKDPYSNDTLRLTNIIAKYNQKKSNRILFAAHWDCRPRCDQDPDPNKRNEFLMGANDGASGVAVLMQLAVHINDIKPKQGIDIVLFDGEDWGMSGDLDNYLLGSKQIHKVLIPEEYDFAILVDLIGDQDQLFYKDRISVRYNSELVDKIWERAAKLGYQEYFSDYVEEMIIDDHVSLLAAGIPTIDIIDFDYKWWHTTEDTPDKCSAESLGRVGQLLLSIIQEPL